MPVCSGYTSTLVSGQSDYFVPSKICVTFQLYFHPSAVKGVLFHSNLSLRKVVGEGVVVLLTDSYVVICWLSETIQNMLQCCSTHVVLSRQFINFYVTKQNQ